MKVTIDINDLKPLLIEAAKIGAEQALQRFQPTTTHVPSSKRLTVADVCKAYKISKPTLYKHIRLGLAFEKIGRSVRFCPKEVDAYFASKRKQIG